jgi:hypothetical protein
MADAAAQRHQQLKNEANKMAMKIPFSHGDDKEGALEIKEMIRRFKNSADTMGLADNTQKRNMFGNYLRGPAAVLWEGMEFYGESKVDWESVKKYFLKQYQGEVDVETFTFKIAKLIEGSNESAVNFEGRCLQSVYEQYKLLPPPVAAAFNADGAAVTAAGKLNIHQATLKMVMDITGIYPIPFTIDRRKFEHNVHVFSNLNEGMILGINFLSKNGLDFYKKFYFVT